MTCTGNPLNACGGPWRLQLYLWNGTITSWNTPANTGYYEVFTFSLPVGARGD